MCGKLMEVDMTDITSIKEYSGSPYNYGVSGWKKHEEEPGGWSWTGKKDEKKYGLESTLFLTDPILEDTMLTVSFTIEELLLNNTPEEILDEEGFPMVGVYFSYYDLDLDEVISLYCREVKAYSFNVKQKAVYWPTKNVISVTGLPVPFQSLQQFYYLPSISMGSAYSCVIGEISVDTVPEPPKPPEPPEPTP